MRTAVLTKKRHYDFLKNLLPNAELTEDLPQGAGCKLICFGSGIIVPEKNLSLWELAINFHAAPPMFPGRDPHHWAVYNNATVYGATAHAMYPAVDEGPICGQLILGVIPTLTCNEYKMIGESAMYSLFTSWCSRPTGFSFDSGIEWTGKKRSRKDLIEMCDMRGLDDREKNRRKKAFIGFEEHYIEE